ncbi:MAG: hypothetical protein LBP43_01015 [Treponema sp.]|nr:hypothetical protein [Treponema sp.]
MKNRDKSQRRHGRCLRKNPGNTALCGFTRAGGEAFGVDLGKTGWDSTKAWWFDPAAGVYSYLGRCGCGGPTSFVPPRKPAGQNDWVLLLRRGT